MSTTFQPGSYVKMLRSVCRPDGRASKDDICCVTHAFDQDGKSVEDYTIRSLRTGATMSGIALNETMAQPVWRMTLEYWRSRPDEAKGVVTEATISEFAEEARERAAAHIGRHYTVIDWELQRRAHSVQPIYLYEGEDFVIIPTDDEYRALTEQLMERIDASRTRGFHPWLFSGSVRIDEQTLLVGTTRENKTLAIELACFEKSGTAPLRAPYSEEIQMANVSRVSAWRSSEVLKKTARVFEAAATRKGGAS